MRRGWGADDAAGMLHYAAHHMISLQLDEWSTLEHAYGSASDVPRLLAQLAAGDETASAELTDRLCHQGSVYSASFAAVPHLTEIARTTSHLRARMDSLILIGHIVGSRDRAPMPPALRAAYDDVQPIALELAIATLQAPIDPSDAPYLVEATAALAGRTQLGHTITAYLDEDDLWIDCPQCEAELCLLPTKAGYVARAANEHRDRPSTPLVAGPTPAHEEDYRWLCRIGGPVFLAEIADRLPIWFGSGSCPACEITFSVLDGLEARL